MIEMAGRFSELIPFLKKIGQRQMREGLVRGENNQLFQEVLCHGRIAQFPVGMSEI